MGQFNKGLLYKHLNTNTPTILEIGAHHGEDSIQFLNMYPAGTLYLFEPDRRCYNIVYNLVSDYKNCHLFNFAISDKCGEIEFNQSDDGGIWDGSGSIVKPLEHVNIFPHIKFNQPYKVLTITLNEFAKAHKLEIIDFVWADVQGAEDKVIIGGLELFKHKVRYLFTEYENVQLYQGAPNLNRILELLEVFRVVEDYPGGCCGDAFLVNTTLEN